MPWFQKKNQFKKLLSLKKRVHEAGHKWQRNNYQEKLNGNEQTKKELRNSTNNSRNANLNTKCPQIEKKIVNQNADKFMKKNQQVSISGDGSKLTAIHFTEQCINFSKGEQWAYPII